MSRAVEGSTIFTKIPGGPDAYTFNWTVVAPSFVLDQSNVFYLNLSSTYEDIVTTCHYFNIAEAAAAVPSESSETPVTSGTETAAMTNDSATPLTPFNDHRDDDHKHTLLLSLGLGIGLGVPLFLILYSTARIYRTRRRAKRAAAVVETLKSPQPRSITPPIPQEMPTCANEDEAEKSTQQPGPFELEGERLEADAGGPLPGEPQNKAASLKSNPETSGVAKSH